MAKKQGMGPLAGVRVLDLSAVVSGPLTARLLADFGADVIKVERLEGDIQRNVGSKRRGYSGSFHMLNRGKRSLAIDLSQPASQAVVQRIARDVDIVVQNFRPGVVERLGVDYETLSKANPGLLYLSISGFGQTGPRAGDRAYDPIIQAFSGMANVQGLKRGEGPEQVNQLILDKLTAYTGVQALCAALFCREKTGQGQHIELSMLDTAIAFLWPDAGADDILLGEDIDHAPPVGAAGMLVSLTDGWAALMTLSDHEFQGLCTALGMTALASDPRFNQLASRQTNRAAYIEVLNASIGEATQGMSLNAFMGALAEHEVPVSAVQILGELHTNPQVMSQEMFYERHHPVAGRMREVRTAARFSATNPAPPRFAPSIGEHTAQLLAEFGMVDQIDALAETRAIDLREDVV
jgi:crotonobetainyl-CoA:carnitine CoA-transferase CaiB-like acyl-CoA transferase